MSILNSILVRSYYAEHGSLLGIENEDFYKRLLKDREPTEDDLVEYLGITAKSMRPATKLAMIEGLSRGDIDNVCERLMVSTKKECWDIAHHEDWRGCPIAINKEHMTESEEKLLNHLTTYLTSNTRTAALTKDFNPVPIRSVLYSQAQANKGRVPSEAFNSLKEIIPTLKTVHTLEHEFVISGNTIFTREKFSKESLGKVMAMLPDHIAFRGGYMTFNDYTLLYKKISQAILEPTFVYLIALSCSLGCTISEMLRQFGFKWLNAIEDFTNLNAVLLPRGIGTVTVLTAKSVRDSDYVILEESIVHDLVQKRKLGLIAWDSDGEAFFDTDSPTYLKDIYIEGGSANEFKNEVL